MTALRQKLLDVFAVEYREHLEAIRQILARTEPSKAELTEAMRRAHSLKGAARAVGLSAVEEIAHRLESLFIDTGKGAHAFDADLRKFVFDALDEIEDKASAPAGTEGRPRPTSAPSEAAAASGGEVGVGEIPRVAPGEDERTPVAEPASIRIDAQNLDRLLRSAGELHADLVQHNMLAADLDHLARSMKALAARLPRQPKAGRANARPVEAASDIAAEVRAMVAGLRAVTRRQQRARLSLSRHLNDLERDVKAARMLPAESAFGAFRKMIRDLAASEGRAVDVVVEGLDCQADRHVLQRMKDPVMHMLRNAVVHGIEPSADRKAAGKPAEGRVVLRLSQDHTGLTILVEDDGRGVDFQKVAAKAVADRRLTAADASLASADALVPLLFEAGFTTVDTVTTIAGRGMGLSVVRETVTALQGSIDVQSEPGKGTKIVLRLPVSILSRRLLVVGFRDALYALPTNSVIRVLRVAPAGLVTVGGRPAVRLDELALPLVSIGELLGAEDPAATPGKFGANVVLVRTGAKSGEGAHIAVVVDSLLGVGEFVVHALDVASSSRRPWSGVVATDEGTPCLVLNPAAFARRELGRGPAVLKAAVANANTVKVVLVVDDSITTRTLEKSILEANGYRVRLSVDGRDALAQVRSERPDLVISDIEMPQMDGFDLVRSIKSDAGLADLPVILVTSRADPADRERGLRLGADAYVVKQRFDQAELLETIRQIV